MEKEILVEGIDESAITTRRRKKDKDIWRTLVFFIVAITLWSTIVYYGYTYAKSYVDTSIRNVQQENAINIQELGERIEQVRQEISSLRGNIENTDSTISNSTVVQERIDEKLENLDLQLKNLEKSLKILKEAPNGQN
ncbi:peptidoglycan hydrolase CwlO-like protein [Anaerosolibacter carboniphilus]|uniref:Peptidoglycan hydrolase CwlO-like protein n=1 Tax=Anaerosolibacter carboniphilus TaxID=1417629 RepID=A0A841KWH2_9FIRM|nr:hypothetical protein [Anaerosolibacter carboniphilus]MBB6217791.1 peptidoglycan hydrolase CwlO-like protein [Anaerosolibacter carboniphilus]